MTVGESPDERAPEDDPALLATALNYFWTWYDGRTQRALQALNYYLVAAAIIFTAYTSAINGKHYKVATTLAAVGLGLTALAIVAFVHEVNAAALAEPPLAELQGRMAGKLSLGSIDVPNPQAGRRGRRAAVFIIFGLAILLNSLALVFALRHGR